MAPRICTAAILALGIAAAAVVVAASDPVTEFGKRVDSYLTLRSRLEEPLPPIGSGRSAWSEVLAKRYLASAIRTARGRAKQGDLFTPPVAALFRQRLADALTPAERLLLPETRDGESGAPLVLVNEPLAAEWLGAVPPRLEQALPALAAGLAFRLVDGDLVLWDAHAEIVVDVLPDAVR